MDMSGHIEALRADLASAAAVADEQGQRIAEQLGRVLEPALRLRLMDILGEAALELNGQLRNGHVEVRLAGREVSLVFAEQAAAEAPPADEEHAARITLRLPESLKTRAEGAAATEGVSLNTWLVRATSRELDRGQRRPGPGQRLTGYATS
jgi:HicB-like protein involved in pilus formation